MFLEFRVNNFRSFSKEQVFSLVANKDTTRLNNNTFTTATELAPPRLLHSAVIYGANSAGKSNLIKAFQYMCNVVTQSASMKAGENFVIQPFRLNPIYNNQPCEFEITFLHEGIRYQYGFSLDTQRIVSEYLLVYKAFKPQKWFERSYDAAAPRKYIYKFGGDLKGKKNVWEEATRENSLFLSMAVQLNAEQLRPIFDFFYTQVVICNDITPLNPHYSIEKLHNHENKKKILDFLASADMSISDIEVKTKTVPSQSVHFDLNAGKTEIRHGEQEVHDLLFYHKTEKGEAIFTQMDESAGTLRNFYLAGPILDILSKGTLLIIDELDSSLHPLLVRQLVELFQNPEINKHHAQLIFTTHDTSLLDSTLFRRDQIWFIEKNIEQESILYSLSDFSVRHNASFERLYLTGRYGALPFLIEWKI